MFDFQTMQLMHLHGGERFPMTERAHHDPADHDPERDWGSGARVFRCTNCDEEIVVLRPDQDRPAAEPG